MRYMAGLAVAGMLIAGCATVDKAEPGEPSEESSSSVGLNAPEPEPSTPEEKVDELAEINHWEIDQYGQPIAVSEWVSGICDELDLAAGDDEHLGMSREQWLVESDTIPEFGLDVLTGSVPIMCSDHTKVVKRAGAGKFARWYGDSEYEVGKDIKPGTYRVKGQISGCYWERTTRDGEIIANNFASAARDITVTVQASDGLFVSRECGIWKHVS